MNDKTLSAIISIGIHLLLLLLFFIWKLEVLPEKILKQIEILEFSTSFSSPEKNSNLMPVKTFGAPGIKSFDEGTKSNVVPSKVDLPKAITSNDNPLEKINIPIEKESALNSLKFDNKIGNSQEKLKSAVAQSGISDSLKQIRDIPLQTDDSEFLQSLIGSVSGNQDGTSFLLEGDVRQRSIISQVKPEYPPGVQKNAVIKIKFDVLPNGSVANLIIIKKADPVLEKISMDALLKWKFNPIAEAVNQSGTITIEFQLK